MKFSVFQISRQGGREKNEDRMGYCYTKESGIFALADGMGGHPEGEVAAQIVLQTMFSLYQKEAIPVIENPKVFLEAAIMTAHRRILQYAAKKHLPDSPRTTIVAVIVQDGMAYWAHCGDSRLYFVRQGMLLARTRDHSYSEQQKSPRFDRTINIRFNRNVLYTCLGSPSKPIFDITDPMPLQQGDRILLCSDGLWSNIPDIDIVTQLSENKVSLVVPQLVDQALTHGGSRSDNVTVVALEWETPDDLFSAEYGISTATMEEGIFSSTLQAAEEDEDLDDLDDEAIERSIAEINEAIRRSAARKS